MKLVILMLVFVGLLFAYYMEVFQSVNVEEEEQGPYTLVYREMSGSDMKEAAEITTALNTLLDERGVTRRRPLSVFYPDGHSEIGFTVEGALPGQLALPETKAREIPKQHYMIARFPWRNRWSFMIGDLKMNPSLTQYRALNGYAKVETYMLKDEETLVYMQPMVKKE